MTVRYETTGAEDRQVRQRMRAIAQSVATGSCFTEKRFALNRGLEAAAGI